MEISGDILWRLIYKVLETGILYNKVIVQLFFLEVYEGWEIVSILF